MARGTTISERHPCLQVPRTHRWWDGRTWTAFAASVEARAVAAPGPPRFAAPAGHSATAIPELAPLPDPGPGCDGRTGDDTLGLADEVAVLRRTLVTLGVTERDRLRTELVDLKNTIPRMVRERDRLRTELVDLNGKVPTLHRERDELLAAVTPLRAELTELRTKQQELKVLRSEIEELRHQKSSLDKELLSELRRSTENLRSTPTRHRFDDS